MSTETHVNVKQGHIRRIKIGCLEGYMYIRYISAQLLGRKMSSKQQLIILTYLIVIQSKVSLEHGNRPVLTQRGCDLCFIAHTQHVIVALVVL